MGWGKETGWTQVLRDLGSQKGLEDLYECPEGLARWSELNTCFMMELSHVVEKRPRLAFLLFQRITNLGNHNSDVKFTQHFLNLFYVKLSVESFCISFS